MENKIYEAQQEKIRLLVSGYLAAEERATLLRQAQSDPELADEIEFSRGLALALQQPELVAASALIAQTIRQEGFPPPLPPKSAAPGSAVWPWLLGIFGAALLTGGLFWAGIFDLFDSREERIARSFMEPLENVLYTPESRNDLSDLKTGLAAYEQGRYREAIPHFERRMRHQPDNTIRLYLATSYLLAEQPEKAIEPLEIAANSQEMPIREAALWYLALTHLKLKDLAAARAALLRLEPSAFYNDQIQQLKSQLER